jgi:hypothetical protein
MVLLRILIAPNVVIRIMILERANNQGYIYYSQLGTLSAALLGLEIIAVTEH